ncbi:unnamed protein product [Rotaria sp. Silwood1]|nr:unnamed protein product [Rotaria sp. Silwood1]
MSWIVEESDNTSAVNVNGDTITCTKDGYYGSPINVMYSDSASENGEYFWQIEFEQMSEQGGTSVGFTTRTFSTNFLNILDFSFVPFYE